MTRRTQPHDQQSAGLGENQMIQVNDAGIIVNSMGYPIDARKLCGSFNVLLSASKGALAALTQNKNFPADITLAKSTLNAAIRQASE
jgi:hypothetical protein